MPPSVVDSGQVATIIKHWVMSIGLSPQLFFQIPLLRWLSREVAGHVFGLWGQDAGKLTVLQGSNKIEADIKEAGDNTLRVMGVKLGKGDKLVAALSNVGGKSITVRFTIK